jgi:rubrerythrin
MPLITTGMVMGFVKDKDGEPFSPDKVKITIQKGTETPITLNVNQEGKFEKSGLAAGIWKITIEVPDYKKVTDEFTIIAGEDTDLEEFKLKEKDEGNDLVDIGTIVLVILVIVIIIILLWVFLGRRERPVEAEEETGRARGRPAAFASGRERESYRDREFYDEVAEGEFMCPVCGNVVGADEPDCPSCGAQFEEDLFECPECGALISGDAMDCPDCGARFEEELPEGEEEYEEEEEEPDITGDYEVEDMDEEEIPFRERE